MSNSKNYSKCKILKQKQENYKSTTHNAVGFLFSKWVIRKNIPSSHPFLFHSLFRDNFSLIKHLNTRLLVFIYIQLRPFGLCTYMCQLSYALNDFFFFLLSSLNSEVLDFKGKYCLKLECNYNFFSCFVTSFSFSLKTSFLSKRQLCSITNMVSLYYQLRNYKFDFFVSHIMYL